MLPARLRHAAAAFVPAAVLSGLLTFNPGTAQASDDAAASPVEAVFIALNDGDFAGARKAAQAASGAGAPDFPAFVDAAELIAADRCDLARPLAERVVAQSPQFLPAYDLVAECMNRAGEARAAARMFRAVAGRLPAGEDREALLSRASALAPQMPVTLDLSARAEPSSNLNRGTDEQMIGGYTIAQQSRRTSGVTLSADIRVEKPVYSSRTLFASVSLVAGAGYDTVSGGIVPFGRAEATLRHLLDGERSVSVTPYAEVAFAQGTVSRVQPGVRLAYDMARGPGSLTVQLDASHVDHTASKARDGLALKLAVSATRRLSGDDKLNLSAEITHDRRHSPTASGTGIRADAEWEHRFDNGLIASVGAGAGARFHEATAPLTTERQLDIFATGSIAFSHEALMIGNVRPEIGYRVTRGWSNDAFSRYTAHDLTIEAKARF